MGGSGRVAGSVEAAEFVAAGSRDVALVVAGILGAAGLSGLEAWAAAETGWPPAGGRSGSFSPSARAVGGTEALIPGADSAAGGEGQDAGAPGAGSGSDGAVDGGCGYAGAPGAGSHGDRAVDGDCGYGGAGAPGTSPGAGWGGMGFADPGLLAAREGLRRFAARDRSGLGAEESLANLDVLAQIGNQAEALTAAVAEEVKRKGAAAKAKGLDVESHLQLESKMPAAQAKRLIKQGEALRPFGLVSRAAQKGEMAPAQAQAVARELKGFPADLLGDKALEEAQAELIEDAGRLGPGALGAKARELVANARRKAGVGGDRDDQLNLEREKAHRGRFLSFRRNGQAMVINGRCPVEVGAKIKRRLEGAALAARRERTDEGNGGDPDAGRLWDPTVSGREDADPFGASLLDALAALADACPQDAPLRAGRPARIVVTMTKDQLGAAAPVATLGEDGGELAPEAVNQLICGAEWAAVLAGSFGEPLDVGRATRGIPPAIRIALSQRDAGCCFPGCGIGPDGCEAHHLRKWVLGGNTSLENLVLACHRHHRLLEPALKLPDGTGWFPGCDDPTRWRAEIDPIHHHPVVIPPARVDPQRKPMLNDRIRVKLERLGAIPKPERSCSQGEGSPQTQKLGSADRREKPAQAPAAQATQAAPEAWPDVAPAGAAAKWGPMEESAQASEPWVEDEFALAAAAAK
ncbi:MAG: HNH endonuclease [Bifidobacteriaceae bacterium]|nr:HNH endonuclease [Bifidobacteriaceae bacterium]